MVRTGLVIAVVALAIATPSRAAERLAIRRATNWNHAELFLADARGEHSLIAPSGLDYNPSFSADGTWIVFTSERSGSADIWRVHPDGSGLQRLTEDQWEDGTGLWLGKGR